MADGYALATATPRWSTSTSRRAPATAMGNLAPAARPVWDRDRRRHPPAIPSRRRAKYLSRPSLTSAHTTARPRRNSCPPARLRHKRRAHQQLGAPRRDQALNPAPRPGGTLGEASSLRMIRRQQRPNDARGVRKGGLQHQGGSRLRTAVNRRRVLSERRRRFPQVLADDEGGLRRETHRTAVGGDTS